MAWDELSRRDMLALADLLSRRLDRALAIIRRLTDEELGREPAEARALLRECEDYPASSFFGVADNYHSGEE